jgi:hypothetical protein
MHGHMADRIGAVLAVCRTACYLAMCLVSSIEASFDLPASDVVLAVNAVDVDGQQHPGGLGVQELPSRRARPARRRIAPVARRISPIVDGATARPNLVSSPWIWRYPHSGSSCEGRTARRAMPGTVGGRPGLCRLLVSS